MKEKRNCNSGDNNDNKVYTVIETIWWDFTAEGEHIRNGKIFQYTSKRGGSIREEAVLIKERFFNRNRYLYGKKDLQ